MAEDVKTKHGKECRVPEDTSLFFPSGGKQTHGVTSKETGISALDIAEVRNRGGEKASPPWVGN